MKNEMDLRSYQSISILDNVLPDPIFENVVKFITNNKNEIITNRTSYWYEFYDPKCPIEEMIDYLKLKVQEAFPNNSVGAEWWVQYKSKEDMGHVLHRDIDDKYYMKTRKVRRPIIGSVFYIGQEDGRAGNLVIYTSPFSKSPIYVPPEPNRLVLFDAGNFLHGVTDHSGKIIEEISSSKNSSSTENIRVSIPVNWWLEQIEGAIKYS
ncbi:hypothetical protein C1N73_33250 (plasmid) [Priestia aryabhattai]